MSEIFEMYQPHTLAQSELKNDGPYLVYGANGVIGKHTSYNHEEAQVLVTCRGATCGAINVSAPFSWINGNAMVIKPRENNVDLAYLKYYLESGIDIKKVITGAAQPQITRQSLSLLKVDLPPLAEQQRIASILDKAELVKRKRELTINKFEVLVESTFVNIFGDVENHLSVGNFINLSDATKKIVTYGIVQAGPHLADGVPYIKTGDIKNGEILVNRLSRTSIEIANAYTRSEISTNDIVMSIRATVGTTALVPSALNGANLTQGTARISARADIEPLYLLHYLRHPVIQQWIQRHVKGATFREITLTKLRELPVHIPSLELQTKFISYLSKFELQKSNTIHSAKLINDLSFSLKGSFFQNE
jgi:type I restriction enzyme S subunit